MSDPLAPAVRALAQGRVVVYPTDTLYGLGARATDRAAVRTVGSLKDRPGDQPLSLGVSSLEELERWAELADPQRAYLRTHLPGPITALVPASREARRRLAPGLVGPDGTLGIRLPDHPVARELARRAGPITATSANRHGRPPARSVREARRTFGDRIAVYLSGPPAPSGHPSSLVDLRGGVRVTERR